MQETEGQKSRENVSLNAEPWFLPLPFYISQKCLQKFRVKFGFKSSFRIFANEKHALIIRKKVYVATYEIVSGILTVT
jgi:hypothetical protein